MAKKNDRAKQKTLAKERIVRLFETAGSFLKDYPSFSKNCIKHAKKISMRYRIRIPKPYNRKYCRKCYSYLIPGYNMKTRIHRKKVVVTCEVCGNMRRYPISEKENK